MLRLYAKYRYMKRSRWYWLNSVWQWHCFRVIQPLCVFRKTDFIQIFYFSHRDYHRLVTIFDIWSWIGHHYDTNAVCTLESHFPYISPTFRSFSLSPFSCPLHSNFPLLEIMLITFNKLFPQPAFLCNNIFGRIFIFNRNHSIKLVNDVVYIAEIFAFFQQLNLCWKDEKWSERTWSIQ